jgi:hypothetical protein
MSTPLVVSILEKVENMKTLCNQFPDYVDYTDLRNTVQGFYEIIPWVLVVANNNKDDQVYWAKEVDVVLGNVVSMFHNLYSSASKNRDGSDATIAMSFALILKELNNYRNALDICVGRNDRSTLKRFSRTINHHRDSPYRWCFIKDKKCVPVLNLQNDVLFEDWVPE